MFEFMFLILIAYNVIHLLTLAPRCVSEIQPRIYNVTVLNPKFFNLSDILKLIGGYATIYSCSNSKTFFNGAVKLLLI